MLTIVDGVTCTISNAVARALDEGNSAIVGDYYIPLIGRVRVFTSLGARNSYEAHVRRLKDKGEFISHTLDGEVVDIVWGRL